MSDSPSNVTKKRSVLVCLGAGGVGKTTISASLAIAAAQAGERVVVLTIDPAKRLADTLGELGNDPTLVEGPWPGELWAAMLDPVETFTAVLEQHGDADQVTRVLGNRLYSAITQSLSGINEYMAAERLHQLHHDDRFDRVIIDTAPSHHAIDFLDSPQRLADFVGHRFYRTVLAPGRGIIKSINAASRLLFRRAAKLVGADLVDDVIGLFADLEGLDEGFRQRAVETSALLKGDNCGYVLVTSPRTEPLNDAEWIVDSLEKRGRTIDAVIVNRMAPFGGRSPAATALEATSDADNRALLANLHELQGLAVEEEALVKERVDDRYPSSTVVRVEEHHQPIRNRIQLAALARKLGQDFW